MSKMGTFYGVGVGPGDPDLITIKAVQILQNVSMVFASCSSKNDYSIAFNIIAPHIDGKPFEFLPFPMTRDPEILTDAWGKNARKILKVLEDGKDAAFVTLGDPLTYSTYGYLINTLKGMHPEIKIRTVPGITSYNAAAALINTPLTQGEESCYIVSGAKGAGNLRRVIDQTENVILLKVYRNFDEIYRALEELDLLDRAICITQCGLKGEMVVEDMRSLRQQEMHYLSLIIIKKEGMQEF